MSNNISTDEAREALLVATDGYVQVRDLLDAFEAAIRAEMTFQHIDWCSSVGVYGAIDCSCPETERESKVEAKLARLRLESENWEEMYWDLLADVGGVSPR